MCSILLIAVLLTELCAGQATPTNTTSPAFFFAPTPCGLCQIAAATAAASHDVFTTHTGISTVSPTASYIIFTAYSVTSEYSTKGLCLTTSRPSISVSPPYSVLRPTSTTASNFKLIAFSSFLDYLGFSSCSGSGEDVTPTTLIPITLANGSVSISELPSANSTSTKASNSRNSTVIPVPGSGNQTLVGQAQVGIGIAIPMTVGALAVGALLVLALLLWRRYRKNKGANAATAEHVKPEDTQPYLQQKPELEAEEKRKQELDAEERRYELDGENGIHEMSDWSSNGLPASRVLQELRGEEHARELEVS